MKVLKNLKLLIALITKLKFIRIKIFHAKFNNHLKVFPHQKLITNHYKQQLIQLQIKFLKFKHRIRSFGLNFMNMKECFQILILKLYMNNNYLKFVTLFNIIINLIFIININDKL